MNWFNQVANNLSAVLKLIMRDREGLQELDNTAQGFWRSFSAIVLIAPLYLFISSIDWSPGEVTSGARASYLFQFFALALQWAIWPLVMVLVTRQAGLGKFYARYVIVYNWSNVIIITALAIPAMLVTIGIMSLEIAMVISGSLQLLTFYLEWYLARLSLETTGIIAAAVVLGNFVLSISVLRLIG